MTIAKVLLLNQEVKLLKQQLAHEKLRSEALLTINEVAELDLQIPIQKSLYPGSYKNGITSRRYFSGIHLQGAGED